MQEVSKVNLMKKTSDRDQQTVDALIHLARTNKRALCSMICAAAPDEYAAMEVTHAQLRYQMTIRQKLTQTRLATREAVALAHATRQEARVVRLRR